MSRHSRVPKAVMALAVTTSFLVPGVAAADESSDLQRLESFWTDSYGGASTSMSLSTDVAALAVPEASSLDLPGTRDRTVLAKARPDECFYGLGDPGNLFVQGGLSDSQVEACVSDGGQLKVNQAYVWGLAKAGHDLWFGTAPNVHCLVLGGYLNATVPHETDAWACEFGASQQAATYGLPAAVGDWRPPDIFVYDTKPDQTRREVKSGVLLDDVVPAYPSHGWTTGDLSRLRATLGLRSGGSIGKVVFLGGPSLAGGVNLFAFRTDVDPHDAFLGSTTLTTITAGGSTVRFSNIRKWLPLNGHLYTAVGFANGRGAVLRWNGSVSKNSVENLFDFEVVGLLDGDGAELAAHEGRVFVATWPGLGHAGLWMSPIVPFGGLTATDAGAWTKVWVADDYEPDPVTAATYGGGALISYGGQLYWGTMHVPFVSTLAHLQAYGSLYGDPTTEQVLSVILGTYRPITIFRGSGLGTAEQTVELVYGLPAMPAFSPGGGWQIVPNAMGATPVYGLSGFGNFFNNYTWTMAVSGDDLFVGTMDWSFLFARMLPTLVEMITGQPAGDVQIELPQILYGADLWRFDTPYTPALPESISGVGNYANYGIRTMIADGDTLYLGTANPMNLHPAGGWELLKLH